jgi:N-acyl-D-aspartate/D-glutamate deacylase
VAYICDASFPTTLLEWWGRDRPDGRLPLEFLVHKQTRATAEAVGLLDRGRVSPGYRADINVIDFDNLQARAPEVHYDLPTGAKRLLQPAKGYLHTFVAGTEIRSDDTRTGATPGTLVRGSRKVAS